MRTRFLASTAAALAGLLAGTLIAPAQGRKAPAKAWTPPRLADGRPDLQGIWNTLLYEFTVDDPQSFTKSWTAQIPLTRSEEPIFEYACHEGNYSMSTILNSARVLEKTAR